MSLILQAAKCYYFIVGLQLKVVSLSLSVFVDYFF